MSVVHAEDYRLRVSETIGPSNARRALSLFELYSLRMPPETLQVIRAQSAFRGLGSFR
jgi:hypothetical protein